MFHESQFHEQNSFVTLTYDDEHLPEDRSLNLRHFQLFMKSLRKSISPKKIKFFHCGEYGDTTFRPHYHVCLFGHQFSDLKPHSRNELGQIIYTSKYLSKLWKHGFSTTSNFSFETAAYVARYVVKKITSIDKIKGGRLDGKTADEYYSFTDSSGKTHLRTPEYATMSRNPGIGKGWIEKYLHDTYKDDTLIIRGKKTSVPKFYDDILEKLDPDLFKKVKLERMLNGKKLKIAGETTSKRLYDKEVCKKSQIKSLKRKVD